MTNQEIKTVGQTIAQETQIGGNTAARVGGVVEGIGVALDNKDAANGYYQATISGGTITVNAPNYLLGSGGNLRIKMPSAGTTASTLTIGNASAVQLWYNGAAVSAQNTWEANEIISVFYDGTRFMASNAQGGGGKAEKIKYDKSQSRLAANNVQEAVDAVFEDVKMPEIEEYSSTLSVPSKAHFRIILPFNFVVGETYYIEISTENAVSQSVRYYVYQTGQYSNNTNKFLGEIPVGKTTAKTTYTPVSETNYQFFGFWNNNNAATSVDVTITKKQKAINNVVSDTQDAVEPLQLEKFFNDRLPNLKVLDYDIYDIKNLNIHNCVVDAKNKWYNTNTSYGPNAKHIAVPVIDGSIVIMRGKYDVMQFWLNSSYNPNTTYNSGAAAPVVGSRQFISGTNAVLYTPTNAAYFAISIVGGDYTKSLMPDEIIVIKKYVNASSEKDVPYITADFEVGCTNATNFRVIKSDDGTYTYFCSHNVSYNFAYIKIPVEVGHKYKLCFNAAARTKLNTDYNGWLYLKKTYPEEHAHGGYYNGCVVILGKTSQEYFEWDFTAEYPAAYLRIAATDMGNPNYGNANIVVKNIKLIDMGTTDMDSVTPILMDGEMSAINSVLDNAAIIDIIDDGLYVCDRYLNVGGYLDTDGIHANNLN